MTTRDLELALYDWLDTILLRLIFRGQRGQP